MPKAVEPPSRGPAEPAEAPGVDAYISNLIHNWSKTLTTLGILLIPLFFILDVFMMPRSLLPRFAIYRLAATLIIAGQYVVLRWTPPSRRSYLHGYFISGVAALMVAVMTTDLGGFNSTYYAGLNMVLIAVNLLLPWSAVHSALNSLGVIGLYVLVNVAAPQHEPVRPELLVNNLYFLVGTAVIAVSINYVKQKLIVQEFFLRADLKRARDALWGEMEVAKRIQTALLPKVHEVNGYRVAATMLPAAEVGGDYYDVIQTAHKEVWLSIGDASGHGVESGLIMMMTQTSLFTTVNRAAGQRPSEVLCLVNAVLRKNIERLGSDRYMTCLAALLKEDAIHFAGKHQDMLIYRAQTGTAEYTPTEGAWLGVVDSLEGQFADVVRPIEAGDVVLLFTDGVTEAMNETREMFGEERLQQVLTTVAPFDVDVIVERIVAEVRSFMHQQRDDLTVVAVKRVGQAPKR